VGSNSSSGHETQFKDLVLLSPDCGPPLDRCRGALASFGTGSGGVVPLREIALRISSAVEVIVTFSELTNHLGRLGMLNDFALTISSAQNLGSDRPPGFGFLSRSFSTELISLYIPSADERLMREFFNRDGRFTIQSAALSGHPASAFLKNSRPLRFDDSPAAEFEPFYTDARSALIVPLKYRGHTVGLLSLESVHPSVFTQHDEHLMGSLPAIWPG